MFSSADIEKQYFVLKKTNRQEDLPVVRREARQPFRE
jgi:hypothetical protein